MTMDLEERTINGTKIITTVSVEEKGKLKRKTK
jgi:hypothetical protein